MTIKVLARHFTPGNVIQSDYWKTYDKVLSFNHDEKEWSVVVIECNRQGIPLPCATKRTHATIPSTRDIVISQYVFLG